VEKHSAAEAAPDAPERTARTEKTALILAPGLVSTNSATLQLVYERRQGKDAEVFVGRTKALTTREVPFWSEALEACSEGVRLPGTSRKVGKQRVIKRRAKGEREGIVGEIRAEDLSGGGNARRLSLHGVSVQRVRKRQKTNRLAFQ
jgi:hypothetical protein